MNYLTFGALFFLVTGVLTSITLLSLFHIFIAIPLFYFIPKTNFKKWSKSTIALAAFSLALVLSVVFNQSIMVEHYAPLKKIKYFLVGFLAIAPVTFFFKTIPNRDKKIKFLIYMFCISTSTATALGLFHQFTGFNIVHWSESALGRNHGVFGMVMNYAHNMAYATIILTGMLLYYKEIEKYVSYKFLLAVSVFNLVGLYYTYTRGAWIGFCVGVPFFYFKEKKRKFFVTVFLAILLGAIAYFAAGRAMYREDRDVSRLGQWQGAIAAFKERPLLGVGFLNYAKVCSEIKYRHNLLAPEFSGHAHNNFFEILADAGLFGIVTYLLWLILWIYEMYKRNDVVAKITFAFIFTFIAGGLTQSTISLGINLFFIMGVYILSQYRPEVVKFK